MRAAVFKKAGQPIAIETLPDPVPGPAQVVIKVHRCGICGSDLHLTSGHAGHFGYPENSRLGHEFAGEVVAVGSAVERLRLGDPITAFPFTGCGRCAACLSGTPNFCREFKGLAGGFAEYCLVNERVATRLPRTVSLADGALVEPLAVALHAVALARLEPGARVHILGAGAIGLGVLFWAKRLGAGPVSMGATSRRREALARQMGADQFVVVSRDGDPALQVEAALGGAPDAVFETAGQTGALAQGVHCVRPRGTVVSLGFCTAPDAIVPAHATWKEVRIQFSMTYSLREFEVVADTLAAGHVEPRAMVTSHIRLADLPCTLEAMREPGPQVKVLVDPWA
jgi:2-desacetyl-2-hydroxyethyl bacteriochlorophyllide A dehydrogenase